MLRSLLLIIYFLAQLASAQEVSVEQNRREARELIERRYYNSDQEVDYKEALTKLEQNFTHKDVSSKDYLLTAWIHFVKNRALGAKPEEEDIGEAINTLNQAATKFPNDTEITFAKYYYSQFSKERFQRELSTKEIEELAKEKKLSSEQQAIYSLRIGAITDSKTQMQNYLEQTTDEPRAKTDTIERMGDLLLISEDATLARSCLETFERAITERPEVAIYYIKAAVCATKGLNFDKAHLYYRNAYDRQRDSKPYKEAYAGSLLLQYIMKKDKWDLDKKVAVLEEAFKLSPSFEIFAFRFSLSVVEEGEEAQKIQLARGEELFGEKVYDLYIYLYQMTDVNFTASVRKELLERIITLAKDDKEKLHFAFSSFLEDLSFNEELKYNRSKYARAFKLAKSYYKEYGASPNEVSIYSFLYLLQFFKTKNFEKLSQAKSLLGQIERQENASAPGAVETLTSSLIEKISNSTGFGENGASFKIKELISPKLESSTGIELFNLKLEEQEFTSLTFKEKYKEELIQVFAPKIVKFEAKDVKIQKQEEKDEVDGESEEISVPSLAENNSSAEDVIEFLNKSRELIGSRDFQGAASFCQSKLQEKNLKVLARNCLYHSYHKLKDYSNALKYVDEILSSDASDERAIMNKAHMIEYHTDQVGSHRAFINQSYQQFPNTEITTAIKEKLLYQDGMGSMDEYLKLSEHVAKGNFSKTLKARTLMNLGNIHYTKQDILKAVKTYNSCIKVGDKKYSKTCKGSLSGICLKNKEDKTIKIYCLRS